MATIGSRTVAVGFSDGQFAMWDSTDGGQSWAPAATDGLNVPRYFAPRSITSLHDTVVMLGSEIGEDGYDTMTILTSEDAGAT